MEREKDIKTVRLKRLEEKLALIQKKEIYLEYELKKIRDTRAILKDKISKEKKAITLVNKAKKLR